MIADQAAVAVRRLAAVEIDALADDLARRFLRLCESAGMAENFDALSGAGLCDRAFAWTSAVYLWLAASLEASADSGDGR